MQSPVIAAIDPRTPDTAPALFGAVVARLLEAPLVLAAAFPVEPSVDRLYPAYARTLRLETERALRPVQDAVAALPDLPLEVSARAVRDQNSPPARAIQQLAEDSGARMLVIGSSARGTLGRVSPGAVTDRLLHGAPCPVAVVPAGHVPPAAGLRRIAAAYLARPDGEAALGAAADLAERAAAVVRVLSVPEPIDPLLAATLDGLALEEVERDRLDWADRQARAAVASLAPEQADGYALLRGPLVEVLAGAAEGADLLVCGSRGRGPVRSVVLGSVAHALVRRAASPVLVVPPAAAHEHRRPPAATALATVR